MITGYGSQVDGLLSTQGGSGSWCWNDPVAGCDWQIAGLKTVGITLLVVMVVALIIKIIS